VKDAGPSGHAAGPVGVVPFLKSYSRALLLARSPPASLALSRKLTWLHMRLRPSWGSHYFTVRYIRRRTDALERALSRRMAVGEADENDAQELESLRTFKSSLPPPPSRIFTGRRPDRSDLAQPGGGRDQLALFRSFAVGISPA
jgi:hypothetical protein